MTFVIFTYQDNERTYLIPATEVGSDKIVAMVQPDSVKMSKELCRLHVSDLPHRPSISKEYYCVMHPRLKLVAMHNSSSYCDSDSFISTFHDNEK